MTTFNLAALNPLFSKSTAQNAYAVFLPAVQPFYVETASGQKTSHRNAGLPAALSNGYASLNFLNPESGLFYYKWALYSAGMAQLDLEKAKARQGMIIDRDKEVSFLFADSGGYQVASKTINVDVKNEAKLDEFRAKSLAWMNECASVIMPLDFPQSKRRLSGERLSFDEALDKTEASLKFIAREHTRRPNDIIANVVQGATMAEQEIWLQRLKGYSTDAWALPWRLHDSVQSMLQLLVSMDGMGLFKTCRYLHFFGVSRLHFAGALTLIMRAMRQKYPELVITYDSAAPLTIAATCGQAYTTWHVEKFKGKRAPERRDEGEKDIGTFTFSHTPVSADIAFRGSDDRFPALTSPLGLQLTVGDLCIREQPTDNGSAWDELSTSLVAAHNVYVHILALTQLNALMDQELKNGPKMALSHVFADFKNIVDRVFSPDTSSTKAMNALYSGKDVLQFFDRKNEVKLFDIKQGELPDWSSTDLEEFPEFTELPLMHE
ncbi:hypothetical protein [Azospirillum brasilense]|uniref:hypothetical protein n=1 Tax=Azospirillum brasilense TaxID=192 RepID=UPI0011C40827|nr:hypothetical protein [Azospirillum brasilense]NUB24329.1 hypothetical protein [Azospirillum brasilense]NUB30844.1 hypothetical protein [Azospirillum brasilense]